MHQPHSPQPRVQIKYDVETAQGTVEKELPFVIGMIGDYAGNHSPYQNTPMAQRTFMDINQHNFDKIMAKISPGLQFNVDNKLSKLKKYLPVTLQFKALSDFEPMAIIQQVPALKSLLAMREELKSLLSQLDCHPELEQTLQQLIKRMTDGNA